MANDRNRNLSKREVFTPLAGGLWECPACAATNASVRRVCDDCGQLVRFTRRSSRVYSAAFFIVAGAVFFAVCLVRQPGHSPWVFLSQLLQSPPDRWSADGVLGAFNWVAVALFAMGAYFLVARPTGNDFLREVRDREFRSPERGPSSRSAP